MPGGVFPLKLLCKNYIRVSSVALKDEQNLHTALRANSRANQGYYLREFIFEHRRQLIGTCTPCSALAPHVVIFKQNLWLKIYSTRSVAIPRAIRTIRQS